MASWRSRKIEIGLTGNGAIPCHFCLDFPVGRAVCWEQQYWLQYLNAADKINFRKGERRHCILAKLSADWELPGQVSFTIITIVRDHS